MLSLLVSAQLAGAQQPASVPQRLTYVVHAYACFSPDDRSLVYQSNAGGSWDLYLANADGTGVRRIVDDPAADITPVFLADGSSIAFVSERDGQREIYVCSADGSDQRRITRDSGQDIHPAWSSDGARILFSSNRGNADPEDYDLYSMRADGGDLVRITSGPDVDTYASWSPDGTRIVTRRVLAGTQNNEVFVMDHDGSNARNLTADAESYDGWPVWSPDGRRIAFSAGPPGRDPHRIVLMDAAGGTQRTELTGPWGPGGYVYDTQPAFSNDGKKLVFTRYRPGERESSELCIVDVPSTG